MSDTTTYSIATPADYDEIVEFGNFVFSYAHRPHEFKTLIPKAYGEARSMWPEHFLAREDGRIRGLVGLETVNQRVAGANLKIGVIGTVSVHPYARGMGYMKKCMAMAADYARVNNYDLLALGGQRQRYEYYGFEPGGTHHTFNVNETNCRHALKDIDASGITFTPFDQARERIGEIHALYESFPVAGARPVENFEQICSTWENKPFAILQDGSLIGYLIASPDMGGIAEIRLKDAAALYTVIKAYLARFSLKGVRLTAPAHMPEYVRPLARICENLSVSTNEMFKIVDYERVTHAYLNLKQIAEGAPLPDGAITLGITDIDEQNETKNLTIRVKDGEIFCRFTGEQPDMTLNTIEAQNLLFSPVPFVDFGKLPACARRYFPLPMYLESADGF